MLEFSCFVKVSKGVALVGVEPTCPCERLILSQLRMPFRHSASQEQDSASSQLQPLRKQDHNDGPENSDNCTDPLRPVAARLQ
jgi:hypothetical protein